MKRLQFYKQIAQKLAHHSDDEISRLLSAAKPFHSGAGGSSAVSTIDGKNIFIKKIALTDLELLPENILSTNNLFDLPLVYQYRFGSAGFGAWRELSAHLEANNWVTTGSCADFPLLYHWRIVSFEPEVTGEAELNRELSIPLWNNSQAIKKRIEALRSASSHLVLFMEYLPQTLSTWLNSQLKAGGKTADRAVEKVDQQIRTLTAFLNAHGFVHFDAHFENLLCHENIFLGDYGLALSSQFALSDNERVFLTEHRSYDRCVAVTSLIQTLMIHFSAENKWRESLAAFLDHESGYAVRVSPYIMATIERYGPVAQALSEFYEAFALEDKLVAYPSSLLESLLRQADSRQPKIIPDF